MKKENTVSLSVIQIEVENATKELRLAQAAFLKASQRLTDADELHSKAMETLNTMVMSLKSSCKVKSLFAQ